jgi:hypothetical protein
MVKKEDVDDGISINTICLTYSNKKSNTVARRVFSRSVSSKNENGEDLTGPKYLCSRLTMFAIFLRLIVDGNGNKGGCSLTLDISINARCLTYNDTKSNTLARCVYSQPVSSQDENSEDLACPLKTLYLVYTFAYYQLKKMCGIIDGQSNWRNFQPMRMSFFSTNSHSCLLSWHIQLASIHSSIIFVDVRLRDRPMKLQRF